MALPSAWLSVNDRRNSIMRFGNTVSTISRGAAVLTAVGAIALALVFAFGPPVRPERSWSLIAFVFIGPAAFLAFCVPTLMVSIRVEEGRVRHFLLGRITLSDFPVKDFVALETQGVAPWAAVLQFTQNRRIRFFGAHRGILRNLEKFLKQEKMAIQSTEPTPGNLT